MNKKQIFSKSLQASKDLVNSLTKEQLEEIMNVFDNYEIEQCAINGVVDSCVDKEHFDNYHQ